MPALCYQPTILPHLYPLNGALGTFTRGGSYSVVFQSCSAVFESYVMAARSRECNLRIRPTDPGVAILSDFESVGPDPPTHRAERGEEILGRNDCFLAVSDGFRRFQTVFDQNSPTDRPSSEKG